VEEIWLHASVGTLWPEHLSASLYQTYLRRLQFWIMRAEDRVRTGTLPDQTSPDFAEAGTPCGDIERLLELCIFAEGARY
jgi:GntR family transcriptional regulator